MTPYKPPSLGASSFNCPHCGAYAQQQWSVVYLEDTEYSGKYTSADFSSARCTHCTSRSVWYGNQMLYPDSSTAPLPNSDLSEDIKNDYNEARSIVNKSPRGAAALLRLCIQKLCKELGEPGKDINTDIGNLVKKGLPSRIQQALDVVRVIGNEAVHPGEIDLNDNRAVANHLFILVNLIADDRITQPKAIETIYNSLPPTKLQGIAQRDKS